MKKRNYFDKCVKMLLAFVYRTRIFLLIAVMNGRSKIGLMNDQIIF